MPILENERVRAVFSEQDGSVRSLFDKRKQIEFIDSSAAAAGDPFRLETDGQGVSGEYARFAFESAESGEAVSLTWETPSGPTVKAVARLPHHSTRLEFRCEVAGAPDVRVISLEYPVIADLGAITDGGKDDVAAHSFATGVVVRNPLKHFEKVGIGLRYMPYPESFSGASMQFFAYCGGNRGGLYFACLDGEGYAKWLNFYKNGNGLLEASFIHGCEDIGPGKGLRIGYPVVVQPLERGDWYEAADLYKAWAHKQYWCAGGKLSERTPGEGDWLHRETGVATFGINAGADRTAWLRRYRELIGTPMFHVLGPDWTNKPQTFGRGVPGGFDDWFPTRFNKDNIACMKQYGDKFAPFEFDYLFNVNGADGEEGRKALQKMPEGMPKSVDRYRFPFICPAAPYTQHFHVQRDEALQRSDDVDAIYYDISANNIMKVCMDDSHGHPVGAGKRINDAYRLNYIRTKRAMEEAAGRRVPMGTEMMNETMLDVLDYYQARAGGQPAAPLELWPVRDLLKSGDAELIPMFGYVYHEFGAVRMDGWGKLTEEIGDLYYFTVARTYLWGGLYELNYEYSPMEALDGIENVPDEHYYAFDPRGYAFSPDRARYLGLFAQLRVGIGNKYFAFGQMMRPLDFASDRVELDWFHYNHGKETPEYNDSGRIAVNAVVHAAWRHKDESVGLFFANISGETREVKMRLDPERLGLYASSCVLHSFRIGQAAESLDLSEALTGEAEFPIPARSVVMLELF